MSGVGSANPREIDCKEGSQIKLKGREQLGGYAASVLSAIALKRYTIGILINFTDLELWYYDRAGAIGSTTFDFHDHFSVLLAIVIAFGLGSSHTFGYLPELVDSSEYPTRFEGKVIKEVVPLRPLSTSIAESSGSVPNMTAVKVVGENIASLEKRRKKGKAVPLLISNAPRVLFGRGTTAYPCTTGRLDNLVMKLSWQPKGRRSEVDFLKMARHIRGIPSLWGHRDISCLANGPRRDLEEHAGDIYRRSGYLPRDMILRAIIIEPRCLPLYSIGDLLTFMKAFKSLLKGNVITH
jgi:Fungal protein kinase